MKLTEDMKAKTQDFYADLKENNAFYKIVFGGKIQHDTVAYFLESIRYLVAHTPVQLALAIQESQKRDYKELEAFFRVKLNEETGHDKWAEADLGKLTLLYPKIRQSYDIDPAIIKILHGNEVNIQKDPYLYLVHIFFAEYFTVLEGAEFLEALEKVGIQQNMMTVVDNHVELDKDHVDEWEEIIDKLVSPQKFREDFLNCLADCFRLYREFCANMEAYNRAA